MASVDDAFRGGAGALIHQGGSPSVRKLTYALTKRWLDVVVVIASAPIALPVIVLLALLVRSDGGPAFYSQTRLGLNGMPFRMRKLRTMRVNSDSALQLYLEQDPGAKKEWDETQKLKRDPRVTRWGSYIRKYSLDELPQLWNVFLGDMSLVGPRPILPEQAQFYPGTAYFDLRPGLTGLWQVSARNESPFARRAIYDTIYAETISLRTDLWILRSTARVILRGTGF